MVVNIAFYENVFFILSLFRTREFTPTSCKWYLAPCNQCPAPHKQRPTPCNQRTAPGILEKLVVSEIDFYLKFTFFRKWCQKISLNNQHAILNILNCISELTLYLDYLK